MVIYDGEVLEGRQMAGGGLTIGLPCELEDLALLVAVHDAKNSLAVEAEDVHLLVACGDGDEVHGRTVG